MDNNTRRYPRTIHEAFNTDCDPISGPYGRQTQWPLAVIFILVLAAGIFLIWSHI